MKKSKMNVTGNGIKKRRRLPAAVLTTAMMLSICGPGQGVWAAGTDETFGAAESPDASGNPALEELAAQMAAGGDAYAFRKGDGNDPMLVSSQAGTGTYPAYFDLRNVDTNGDGQGDTSYVTSVKLQNPYGSCWGFSAVSAAETSILGDPAFSQLGLTADTMDLSEKHVSWFCQSTISDPEDSQYGEGRVFVPGTGENESQRLNAGGMPFYATGLFAGGVGPVYDLDQGKQDEVDLEYNFRYHGKDRLVRYRKKNDKGSYVYQIAPESQPPEGMTPYSYSTDDDWSIDEQFKYMQDFRLAESYILPSSVDKTGTERTAAINAVKEMLMNKRAVQVGFRSDTSNPADLDGNANETKYISQYWAHYTYDHSGASHAVTIVGWDDNYPKENFRHPIKNTTETKAKRLTTPSHNGAWLVKNSWGSEEEEFPDKGTGAWGTLKGQDIPGSDYSVTEEVHTGYFWISYDDTSITGLEALRFEPVTEEEMIIYQYDRMPVSGVNAAFMDDEAKMANVFRADGDILLEQVSCQTTTPGTRVHYAIYNLGLKPGDPEDGTLLLEMDRTYPYGGYHKEDLSEALPVWAGRYFSVVVTQVTPDDKYTVSIQTAKGISYCQEDINAGKSALYSVGVINEGESRVLVGEEWLDLSQDWLQDKLKGEERAGLEMDNFPIKVYAVSAELPPEEPEFTSPTARTGLIYSGQPQELIDAGSTEDGTMLYALVTGEKEMPAQEAFGEEIPRAQNAGTYYIWYKVAGDNGYGDTEPQRLEVTIARGKWVKSSGSWKYADLQGWYAKNQWLQIDGEWYFFGSDGLMEQEAYRNGWYLTKTGAWDGCEAVAVWTKAEGGWQYILQDGSPLSDTWMKIDGKWYFFKNSGFMAQNEYCGGYWLGKDGSWTYHAKASWKKNSRGWYYSDTTGWYAKNMTLTIDGVKYTFDAKGYWIEP